MLSPCINTVLAPLMLPLVILTDVRVMELFCVIVKLPAKVPPVMFIPERAVAPPNRFVPLVVMVLLLLVTNPETLPPTRLILPPAVIVPKTTLAPVEVTFPSVAERLIRTEFDPTVVLDESANPPLATIVDVALAVITSPAANETLPLLMQV